MHSAVNLGWHIWVTWGKNEIDSCLQMVYWEHSAETDLEGTSKQDWAEGESDPQWGSSWGFSRSFREPRAQIKARVGFAFIFPHSTSHWAQPPLARKVALGEVVSCSWAHHPCRDAALRCSQQRGDGCLALRRGSAWRKFPTQSLLVLRFTCSLEWVLLPQLLRNEWGMKLLWSLKGEIER